MEDNSAFKIYFAEKKYAECTQLLKNKIVNFIITQINEFDSTFKFTTVSDLIVASDFYLKNSTIAKQLQIALKEENNLEQIRHLLLICETNKII